MGQLNGVFWTETRMNERKIRNLKSFLRKQICLNRLTANQLTSFIIESEFNHYKWFHALVGILNQIPLLLTLWRDYLCNPQWFQHRNCQYVSKIKMLKLKLEDSRLLLHVGLISKTYILLSFLYWVKAPGGMILMRFCSKRLKTKKK